MKICYISLGSFCHPKILIRETNRNIKESLPFDFHSSPGTYSIYNILNELYINKTYDVEFNEILFKHNFNADHKDQLAIKEKNDLYFLHFFDTNDLKNIPSEYPCSIDLIKESKIIEVKNKFKKRFDKLYQILNDPENILIFLRIDNYENNVWDSDLNKLCKSIKQFNNPNKFLIYSQILIDENLAFNKTNTLNYNYDIPVMFVKEKFDENISYSTKKYFLNILETFETIIEKSYIFLINNIKQLYYFDSDKNIFYNINDLNNYFNLIESTDKKNILKILYNNEKFVFKFYDGCYKLYY